MHYYHIAFHSPCKDCKGSIDFYPDLYTKLWKQLMQQQSQESYDGTLPRDALPKPLLGASKNLFQLLLGLQAGNKDIPEVSAKLNENGWIDLVENECNDLFLENRLNKLNNTNWSELYDTEMIAEQLHNIADSMTEKFYSLHIYWLTCGHAECIEISDNVAIHGALKRLQIWNMASITFICNLDILCERDFKDSWLKTQSIFIVTQDEKMLQDNNIIWQGSLECLQNEENEGNENWYLSKTLCSSLGARLSYSEKDEIPALIQDDHVLADSIKIICELPKTSVPFWKIFPSQFILYHKSLIKRVFELRETSDFERISENNDTLLLASIATCDRKHRTTTHWIEFITSDTSHIDKVETNFHEVHYLVFYAVEPGIFIAYFLRPEDSFINLHFSLAIHRALYFSSENLDDKTLYADLQERRMLQLLDAIQSSQKSPLKSEFSLAVHLDASEMLKYFTEDGKPMTKELTSLLNQIEEKRKISPGKRTEIQCRRDVPGVVEYCLDNTSDVSCAAKLLPKHETLSICNTPKTLAKLRLQDEKRNTSKSETLSIKSADETSEPGPSSSTDKALLEQLEVTKKDEKSRLENPTRISNEQRKKNTQKKRNSSEGKKKRRSFDGNEAVQATNAKEKRSDRHKRRLARVVKRTLVKYGVDTAEEYFTTCSERLYYLCKSFLKDLKTSEGLNNEMKRLAESNVSTVVEFEKRRHASKTNVTPQ